jgi:hypothetical protein
MPWKVVNYLSVAHDFWWGLVKSRELNRGDCNSEESFAWYSTHYHTRMILPAAFCVLRIMRSKLREVIAVNDVTIAAQSNQLCKKEIHTTNGS